MLRILHTSDWHLGLELSGHRRLAEQKKFLDWLRQTCRERNIDALIISGDIYDTTNPPIEAQKLFADFLIHFHEELPQAQAVAISGNHDSGARLELPRPFTEALGNLHLFGTVDADPSRHLVPLTDASGNHAAWCLAIPFLRPSDLDCRQREGESPAEAFTRATEEFYRAARAAIPAAESSLPVISMGHLTLTGSSRAGSERTIIGGIDSMPISVLAEGADYVALGHIHRAQKMGHDFVRYCGTPYPVDFDEATFPHLVLDVELDTGKPPVIQTVEVPVFVPLKSFGGKKTSWDALEQEVKNFDWSTWENKEMELRPLVKFSYHNSVPVTGLRSRCEELCHGLPLRLVGAPQDLGGDDEARPEVQAHADLHGAGAPLELLKMVWAHDYDGAEIPGDVRRCFEEVMSEIVTEGETR